MASKVVGLSKAQLRLALTSDIFRKRLQQSLGLSNAEMQRSLDKSSVRVFGKKKFRTRPEVIGSKNASPKYANGGSLWVLGARSVDAR
jgi:hypothetical protein